MRVLHRPPMKLRKGITGPRIDFSHPVVQPSVPLTRRKVLPPYAEDRIYFPDEQHISEEEKPKKIVVVRSGFDKVDSRNKSIDSKIKVDEEKVLDAVPRCSHEGNFCESVPTYPYAAVNKMLKNLVRKDFFGLEEDEVEPWNRMDGEGEEKFMCQSYTKVIRPQSGKTLDGKWKYIINLENQEYVQAIKIEICKNPKKPCEMSHNFPRDVITTCKQKYMNRRLLSISNNGSAEPDIYALPSGCSCSYKRNPQFLTYFKRN